MNLLITGAWREAKDYIYTIEEMGHNVLFMQYEHDQIPCPYEWVDGVICNGLFLTHPINKFPNLKYIQLTSAGYDRILLEDVEKRHIIIHNACGVYSVPMAEYAIASVLQFYKKYRFFSENQNNHKWEKQRDLMELTDKRVLIVGCGDVGSECAKRFVAFGCHVMGVDIDITPRANFENIYSTDQFAKQLPYADIVILTLPLTEQTYHLVDSTVADNFKKGSILVNIARGGIVDIDAILPRLQRREMFAVLDVTEEEPLSPNSLLWDLDNVFLTPHNSFVGNKNAIRLSQTILNSLCQESKEK